MRPVFLFLFLAIFLPAARAQQPLADFRRIVIADQPLPVEKAAAEELANYAGQIAGTKLEIIPASKYAAAPGLSFFIGTAATVAPHGEKLAPWKDEEWLIRSVEQGLILAGDDRDGNPWTASTYAGSMLAVYTLLEDYLGVHWFWPGAFGEEVPSTPAAVIPHLELRATPAFRIRSFSLGYTAYHTPAFADAGRKWYRRSRLGWTQSAVFGHSWDPAFNLRSGEVEKNHPEWLALVHGQRRPPQMCTSNPEVIDHMVEWVLKGKTDIVNISPSDGGGFCECNEQTKSETHQRLGLPSCTALDVPGLFAYNGTIQLSDRIFTYANEVARRVRERDPKKSVGMFAYTYYNHPPAHIKQLEPNLYLSFVYQAASFRDAEAYQGWKDSVAGWQALGARMVVREGWGNHYYLDLPFLQYDQVIANLAEAHRLGFVAAYGDGNKAFSTQAPNAWAITHMLWNPERDPATVMDTFFDSAYGPAAGEMRAFFGAYNSALDRNWSKRRRLVDTPIIAYANVINSWSTLFPRETVEEAERHLQAAEKLAGAAGKYAERVAFHRFGQEYTRTMLELLDDYRQLAEGGLRIDSFMPVEPAPKPDLAKLEPLLRRAYQLGEDRERLLLAHRDWAALDEGLYTFTNDRKIRQWHGQIKLALKIEQPSALTQKSLGH